MKNRITIFWEEINYYRECNKDLKAENLLRKNKEKQSMNDEKIKDNERRIEKLFSEMMIE